MGALFTSNLKFGSHISQIVHKANRLIGLIRQTFSYLDPPMLRVLYVGLVHPHLDYACVIWNPYQLGDMRAIENVQRRATRLTSGMKQLCYHDRLATLNLPSLLYRRRRMDMIMVYIIVHGLDGIHFEDIFTYSDTTARSKSYKLFKHHSRLNIHKYSFSECIVNDWNSLPQDIVEAPNLLVSNPNWIFIGIIIVLYLAKFELSWFYKTMSSM